MIYCLNLFVCFRKKENPYVMKGPRFQHLNSHIAFYRMCSRSLPIDIRSVLLEGEKFHVELYDYRGFLNTQVLEYSSYKSLNVLHIFFLLTMALGIWMYYQRQCVWYYDVFGIASGSIICTFFSDNVFFCLAYNFFIVWPLSSFACWWTTMHVSGWHFCDLDLWT